VRKYCTTPRFHADRFEIMLAALFQRIARRCMYDSNGLEHDVINNVVRLRRRSDSNRTARE
jgi:hypothetical protein